MRYLHWSDDALLPKKIESRDTLILSPDNLSESDILQLQDKFLTNGFSSIHVQDINTGRAIIKLFLDTHEVYNNVACLTITKNPLKNCIFDIFHEIIYNHNIDTNFRLLDEFLLEEFYFDFMWVETTQQLYAASWYHDFIQKIVDSNIDKHIPVIVITYKDEENRC